ncbi:MAG: hypothetical protein ABJF50_25030 [Paracoccaceae bacterium]
MIKTRQFMKAVLTLVLVAIILTSVVVWAVILEDRALVPEVLPPSPEDVRATREFVHQVRAATSDAVTRNPIVRIDVDDWRSLQRMGGRFLTGFRSQTKIANGDVVIKASLPIPWFSGQKWLNASARIPPFEGVVALADLQVGKLSLPPHLSLQAARVVTNLVLGRSRGDKMLNSASRMQLDGDTILFTMQLDEDSRGSVMRGLFGVLRGRNMPTAEEIDQYYVKIRKAIDAGDLPLNGSFLSYIRFAFEAVLDDKTHTDLANKYTAAIFALTKACGARDFRLVVGPLAGASNDQLGTWQKGCTETTLANRIDSKRHFITAAALRAASNRGVSIPIGEFKELYDTISGAGGFDFTDIAANNSGIRLSDLMMSEGIEQWPDILARIKSESDLIISFDGIPSLMPEPEFKARYGDVESVKYMEMFNLIERRIDQLALHRSKAQPSANTN